MRKIPTVFQREPDDRWKVIDKVTPGCEWVLAGEGQATRKYDGVCVMLDSEGMWFRRREIKKGKPIPDDFVEADYDEVTGKRQGWVPMDPQGYLHPFLDALEVNGDHEWTPGTYELVGPKVNGNPEKLERHDLRMHRLAERAFLPDLLDYKTCKRVIEDLAEHGWEGIVWHHPDGRMAKLKARDF